MKRIEHPIVALFTFEVLITPGAQGIPDDCCSWDLRLPMEEAIREITPAWKFSTEILYSGARIIERR